jgi:hypothetical protein
MKLFGRKKRKGLSRRLSLSAKPAQAPDSHALPREDGGVNVTVHFQRPRWQQLLGAEESATRTFGLDRYGRSVYELCTGGRNVKKIIRDFARRQKISQSEAEMSVTAFLKTMVGKGLIVMELEPADGRNR